jgi:outer membrane protein OmpA-like peptidoglycan-associated protein
MKKQLLLIGLIFAMFTLFAQEVNQTEKATTPDEETAAVVDNDFCPHRIWLRFGGGYANNTFKEIKDVATRCSYHAMAELGYTYFFHRNVGIGIGVGINHVGNIAKINEHKKLTNVFYPLYHGEPNNPDIYDYLIYTATDLKEKHNVWAIEVPLTVQFEKKWGKHGIYAGVGVKGYFPFTANVKFTDGVISIDEIYEEYIDAPFHNLFRWMEDSELKGVGSKQKMRCSIDVLGEFGGIFGLSRAVDLYVGVYGSYGFLNIYPKGNKMSFENLNEIDYALAPIAGRYANSTDKWHLVQAGLKIGFHFLPCKSCTNEDYMKDAKRKYMDEMMKKQKEPIIVTNTVEYYYFVPSISQELADVQDPNKKKALLDLAQALSNIKILFDLDKDIPKVDKIHIYHIDRAVEVLKENDDLKVVITGYTSPEGTKDHNQDLGHRRALAVRQIFINKGIPVDQIAIQNYIAEDAQHKIDIPEKDCKEQRAVIFKIEKK